MAGVNGSDARTVVAVIGAGIMGSAMARNLAAAGLDTRVWDGSPAAAAALADAGATAAASAPDAVRDASGRRWARSASRRPWPSGTGWPRSGPA